MSHSELETLREEVARLSALVEKRSKPKVERPGTEPTPDNIKAKFYIMGIDSGYTIDAAATIEHNNWDLHQLMATQWAQGSVEHRCAISITSAERNRLKVKTYSRKDWLEDHPQPPPGNLFDFAQ